MRASRSGGRHVLGLGVVMAGALSGCFVVTDLGRFNQTQGSNSKYYDLRFTVKGMDSHVAEYFELRIMDGQQNLRTRVVALPLGGRDATFNIPAAVAKAASGRGLKLQFYAEHNKTTKFDTAPPPGDHSWTLAVDDFLPKDTQGVVDTGADRMEIVFNHTAVFQGLDDIKSANSPAIVRFSNMGGFLDRRVQVRVADANSGVAAALFRQTKVSAPAFEARVDNTLDPGAGTRYTIEITADDGLGGGLVAWRFEKATDAAGLAFDFDPARSDAEKVKDADLKTVSPP